MQRNSSEVQVMKSAHNGATKWLGQDGNAMESEAVMKSNSPKLGWTLEELARSLSVSVPFLRLEVKRGRLRAAHLGRRVVVLDAEVRRYLAEASSRAA
jgi:excisionase family DNA binding protein